MLALTLPTPGDSLETAKHVATLRKRKKPALKTCPKKDVEFDHPRFFPRVPELTQETGAVIHASPGFREEVAPRWRT